MSSLKHQLHAHCLNFVQERIHQAQEVIRHAQQSANEETKSSSGDKYETGRAMAQLEIEKSSQQLAEALQLKNTLEKISPDVRSEVVQPGSLVITDQGNFYIAISAGQFQLDGINYVIISPASPLARVLLGQKIHTTVAFQSRKFAIQEIL